MRDGQGKGDREKVVRERRKGWEKGEKGREKGEQRDKRRIAENKKNDLK
jgi:hypothetical protein